MILVNFFLCFKLSYPSISLHFSATLVLIGQKIDPVPLCILPDEAEGDKKKKDKKKKKGEKEEKEKDKKKGPSKATVKAMQEALAKMKEVRQLDSGERGSTGTSCRV